MGHDRNVIGGRHRCDFDKFCQSPERKIRKDEVCQSYGPCPIKNRHLSHDIRLNDIDRSVLDELSEAVLGVLVFARRPFHCWQCALELRLGVSVPRRAGFRVPSTHQSVTVKIVRVEDLLPPVNVDLLVNASLKTIHQLRGQILLGNCQLTCASSIAYCTFKLM